MALFSISDLRFTTAAKRVGLNGRLAGSGYDSNIFRYPIDIGDVDKAHYMVFHINVQQKTEFQTSSDVTDLPTILQNRQDDPLSSPFSSLSNFIDSSVGATRSFMSTGNEMDTQSEYYTNESQSGFGLTNNIVQGLTNSVNVIDDFNKEFLRPLTNIGARTIKRTTETIALYMPDTLAFNYSQSYDGLSLAGGVMDLLGAGSSIADSIKSLKGSGLTKEALLKQGLNLSPFAVDFFGRKLLGDNLARAGVAALGLAKNPLLEVVYSSPEFRRFRFEFMFYPRSEKEAIEVQQILERLRFHQAPEISKGQAGIFMVPPSEFDIKFYYNGKQNINLPKISTSVLTGIDVDYAPNGFAAYETFGQNYPSQGKTGMPVAIRLGLQFMETEILTKGSYRSGGSLSSSSGESGAPISDTEDVNNYGYDYDGAASGTSEIYT